jgi:hypothetical protein
MGACRNQGSPCEETDHCTRRRPQAASSSAGVSVEYNEYPITQFRTGNYNIPKRTGDAVMHPSVFVSFSATGPPGGAGTSGYVDGGAAATTTNCGKLRYTQCASGFGGGDFVYDYYPDELSFDWQSSDTWISYIFDTSGTPGAGGAGYPVYYIETCTTNSTSTTQGTPQVPATSTTTTTSTTSCQPCTAHTCTPAITDVKYTYSGQNLTNDLDCPFPDLFGIGTDSQKVVFQYNQLSSTLPDGVTDFQFSYNGATYVDVYDEVLQIGTEYVSTQNPWQVGDESFNTFEIYDQELETATKTGFRVKVRIEPVIDETVDPAVFTGTRWTVLELMNPGSNYAVNDVFKLEYVHTHPDTTQTTLEVDLKITSVGPVQVVQGQSGFDVMRAGDVINGHNIIRVYHTDLDNFLYHVVYLDGSGSNFAKDTQYTSSRNHVITAKAGFGIADRACLIGRYEFTEQSVQYVTASFDKNSPDVFNSVKLPEAVATVTNGVVTGFTITEVGANLTRAFLNGQDPDLVVAGPPSENGKEAIVQGIFVGGALSSIKIISGGTLYDENQPPRVFISNTYRKETTKYSNDGYEPGRVNRYNEYFDAYPGQEDSNARQDFRETAETVPEDITFTNKVENIEVKYDPERNRLDALAQSLYSKGKTDPLKDILSRSVDLKHLQKFDYKSMVTDIMKEEADRKTRIIKSIDDITQEVIPEFKNLPEVLIETVQGRIGDLPYGSQFTKYVIRQYRADPSARATINVTLSCTPTTPGVNTTVCPPPTPPIVPPTSVTDPTTGATNSTSTTCVVTGPHGPGCTSWEVSGQMLFLHDLTRSAATVVAASKAYGNPLIQT